MATAAHPALTCRVSCCKPGLRCRSQATTLLSCGFKSNVGHMLACTVILCHLRHTRATGPALWKPQDRYMHCTKVLIRRQTLDNEATVPWHVLLDEMKRHLSIGGRRRKISPSTSSPSEFKVVVRGAAMLAAAYSRSQSAGAAGTTQLRACRRSDHQQRVVGTVTSQSQADMCSSATCCSKHCDPAVSQQSRPCMDRLVMRDACRSGQQRTNASPKVLGEQAACAVLNSDKGPRKLAVSSMQMVLKCEQGLQAIPGSMHLVLRQRNCAAFNA